MQPVLGAIIGLGGAAVGAFFGGGPRHDTTNEATQAHVFQNPQMRQSPHLHQDPHLEQNPQSNQTYTNRTNTYAAQQLSPEISPQIRTGGAASQSHVTVNNDTKPNVTIIFTSSPGQGNTVDHDVGAPQYSEMRQEHRQEHREEHRVETTQRTSARPSSLPTSGITNATTTRTATPSAARRADNPPQAPNADNGQQVHYARFYSSVAHRPRHPLRIAAAASLVGTCGLFYFLRSAEFAAQQKKQWCNWKEEVATKDLAAADNLATELIMDIQRRYTTTKNAHDFIEPLQIFLNDIEEEKTTLTWYLAMSSFMHKICIGKIFGINDLSLKKATDRLQRVDIIKKIFIGWTAEYKLGNHAR
jgi:hypothetical protein